MGVLLQSTLFTLSGAGFEARTLTRTRIFFFCRSIDPPVIILSAMMEVSKPEVPCENRQNDWRKRKGRFTGKTVFCGVIHGAPLHSLASFYCCRKYRLIRIDNRVGNVQKLYISHPVVYCLGFHKQLRCSHKECRIRVKKR